MKALGEGKDSFRETIPIDKVGYDRYSFFTY